MAVKIRLMRKGKKKQPTYRVVVADSHSPRDGRFIEIIGQYAPRHDPSLVTIDTDKAVAWLQKGAQPTEQVARLLEVTGVWDAFRSATGRDAAAKPKARAARPPRSAPRAPEPAAEVPSAPEPTAEAPADVAADDGDAAPTADTEEAGE